MAKFNPEDYEPVEVRIKKFYEIHPKGSILTELSKHTQDFGKVVFMAVCFDETGQPLATGWAMEEQGKGMVNGSSHVENCETSAIGRALANMGLHGNKRPSREEMEKASRPNDSGKLIADVKNAVAAAKARGIDEPVVEGYRRDAQEAWKKNNLDELRRIVGELNGLQVEAEEELF